MRCPFCGNEETSVKDSRTYSDGESIKRRRICNNCGERFNTLELVLRKDITVVKKDGTKEAFEKYKLKNSIKLGSGKRLSEAEILGIVNAVQNKLESIAGDEVKSIEIGQMVMDELEKIDKISFIRFASVYMNFEDPKDFKNFINKLKSSDK